MLPIPTPVRPNGRAALVLLCLSGPSRQPRAGLAIVTTPASRPHAALPSAPPTGLLAPSTERDRQLAHWLSAAAQGDAVAFEAFFDATLAHAQALIARLDIVGDAQGLLTESYFQAWREARRFEPQHTLALVWFLGLLYRRAQPLRRQPTHAAGLDPIQP